MEIVSFSEFLKMKQLNQSGRDIKKSEEAALREILCAIRDNERWLSKKKNLVMNFVNRIQ